MSTIFDYDSIKHFFGKLFGFDSDDESENDPDYYSDFSPVISSDDSPRNTKTNSSNNSSNDDSKDNDESDENELNNEFEITNSEDEQYSNYSVEDEFDEENPLTSSKERSYPMPIHNVNPNDTNPLISPRQIMMKPNRNYQNDNNGKSKSIHLFSSNETEVDSIVDDDYLPNFDEDNMQLLGEGACGEVYKTTDLDSGREIALKKIEITNKNIENIISEIATHKAMKHSNIVEFFGAYYSEGYLYVSMQFMNMGSLCDLLEKIQGSIQLTNQHISYFFREIVKGLAYLHGNKFIHRDIKSDNVLLNEKGEVKIADFGLCIQTDIAKGNVGSPYWMAPEIILDQSYNYKVDIYSVGVVLYELVDGNPPYLFDYCGYELKDVIVEKGIPQPENTDCDKEILRTIERCTLKDPYMRPDCIELLENENFPKASSRSDIISFFHKISLLSKDIDNDD